MPNVPLEVGSENANYKIFLHFNAPILSLKRGYFYLPF